MSVSLRRGFAAVFALAAIAALAQGLPAGADPAQPEPARPHAPVAAGAAATATVKVTLITGDVVRVTTLAGGKTAAAVDQSAGSSGGVKMQTVGKDLYVIPDVAQPYLAAGRLDRQLFNVTGLVAQGYADSERGTLPLIAEYAGGVRTSAARQAPDGSAKVRDLGSINAAAIAADKDEADEFWDDLTPRGVRLSDGIEKLWLDARIEADLADSVPQVRAPQAWALGADGTGATVAVLDTGVDRTHPDLVDRVDDAVSFVPGEDAGDRNGHGTHVSSTVAGSGAASGGLNKGVAPGVRLIMGKVLDDSGFGQESWIIDGMEWASTRADVVNMSLGDSTPSDGTDPLSQAVNELTAETGTLFVVAAGNSYDEFTLGAPGVADAALTVAAVDGSDQRAYFSSMGPRVGDYALKPDISAPGVDVTAARSQDSLGEGMYVSYDGTSMATPHVAGAAAIVAAKHPDWPAQRIKDALMSSAAGIAGTPYEVGTGRLDVLTAIDDIDATGSAFLGFYGWPHDGDPVATRTITYRNSGATPAVLTLAGELTGSDGAAHPGLLSLSASEVTVPANGSVDVAIAADPDDAGGPGRYMGAVVATDASGAVMARTAVGLVLEDERYTLDIRVLDRDGNPAKGDVWFYEYGTDWVYTLPLDATGRAMPQRVRPGMYDVSIWLDVPGESGPDSAGIALLAEPDVVMDADREVVLDAREANRVSVRTPRPSEDRYRRVQYFHDSGLFDYLGSFTNSYIVPPNVDDIFVSPTGDVAGKQFEFAVRWRRSAPVLDLDARVPGQTIPLDPLYQGGSTRLDGKRSLRGVDAGIGTPDAYAGLDVRGKAVLVTRDDSVQSWERAQAATDAGAALLLVINDRPGKLYEYGAGTDLPILSLTQVEGAPLLAAARAGRLVLLSRATASPAYMYDLVDNDEAGIPADPSFAPQTRDLARIDERFVGERADLGFEGAFDCRSFQWPPCIGWYEPIKTRSTRIDYVTTQPGVTWYRDAIHATGWEQRHQQMQYHPGQQIRRDWFSPITRPRLGPGFWAPERQGDFMNLNVPFASGDDGITGYMYEPEPAGAVRSRLYLGDELLREESPFQGVWAEVPSEPAWYRFEQDTARDAEIWRTSIRTHSAWTYRSAHAADGVIELLPLLQLDYDVKTNLTGSLPAGTRGAIGIAARHEPGVTGGGVAVGATLAISFDDGDTWTPLQLGRTDDGGWLAKVQYPRAKGSYVSLKASAWDDAGNRVEQEIVRAYRLG